jgi:hypothetical protein
MSDTPRTLDELLAVCRLMADYPVPWWVGGGWAIDAWLGEASREHEDVEVCVLREDQGRLHAHLAEHGGSWRFLTPVDERWAELPVGDRWLDPPRFMLRVQATPETRPNVAGLPPAFEFLVNDVDGGEWLFPLDRAIRVPLERVAVASALGLPVVAPEILLLLKAWNRRRASVPNKDEHDFQRARPRMTPEQRGWLRKHLERLRPDDPWIPQLG